MKNIKKIKPFFTDNRGEMSHLIDTGTKIRSILLITCKKGAIRANHYHKKDTHYSYLLSGKMRYSFVDMKDTKAKKKSVIINPGEIVFTPSMEGHAMEFLEDSVFLAIATEPRKQLDYEKDTVKINLV